jgi:medium-chain acyl-[acyl-carrier-protein] hydrolase
MPVDSLSPWVVRHEPRPLATAAVVCFGVAGGNASSFKDWSRQLPPSTEVWAIQLPGRQQRILERPQTRLIPLASLLAEFLSPLLPRHWAAFGTCTGALLAYEVVARIRDLNGRQPFRFVSACCRAPSLPDRDAPIHKLPDADLVRQLHQLGGTNLEVLEHPEFMAQILGVMREDFEMAETYPGTALAAIDCPITAFSGQDDEVVLAEEVRQWSRHTQSAFDHVELPGGHFLVETNPIPLLSALTRLFTRDLEGRSAAAEEDKRHSRVGTPWRRTSEIR